MATTTFFRCSIREAESKAEQSIGSVDKKKKNLSGCRHIPKVGD